MRRKGSCSIRRSDLGIEIPSFSRRERLSARLKLRFGLPRQHENSLRQGHTWVMCAVLKGCFAEINSLA